MVFFSSTGFVLNKHFCQEELKSVAIFTKAEPCHSQKAMRNCPMHGEMEMPVSPASKNCCDDTTDYFKSDADQMSVSTGLDLETHLVLWTVALLTSNIQHFSIDKQSIHYLNYKPPLIVCDLPLSLQNFRC